MKATHDLNSNDSTGPPSLKTLVYCRKKEILYIIARPFFHQHTSNQVQQVAANKLGRSPNGG
jgi:hypothetical protein